MSNMSYCRFQNTASDLDDCKAALLAMVEGDAGKLSRDELRAAKRLVVSCAEIISLLAEDVEGFVSNPDLIEEAVQMLNDDAEEAE